MTYLLGYGGEISVRLHLLYFLFMRTRYDYLLGCGGEIYVRLHLLYFLFMRTRYEDMEVIYLI